MDESATIELEQTTTPEEAPPSVAPPVNQQAVKSEIEALFGKAAEQPTTADAVETALDNVDSDLAKLETTLEEAIADADAQLEKEVNTTSVETPAEPEPVAEAPPPAEEPAPSPSPTDHVPRWHLPMRIIRAVVALPMRILIVLDWPFRGMDRGMKAVLGYAGIGTSIVAAATWIAGRHMMHL